MAEIEEGLCDWAGRQPRSRVGARHSAGNYIVSLMLNMTDPLEHGTGMGVNLSGGAQCFWLCETGKAANL